MPPGPDGNPVHPVILSKITRFGFFATFNGKQGNEVPIYSGIVGLVTKFGCKCLPCPEDAASHGSSEIFFVRDSATMSSLTGLKPVWRAPIFEVLH